MAKISTDGKYPKRIGNYIIYTLNDEKIIRNVSGFTSEGMKNSPKYALSRMNASEFGRLSSFCKLFRMALGELMPRTNKLLVVNNFTKIMRQVQLCDPIHVKGERNLATALQTEEGRAQLRGYNFNADGTMLLAVALVENCVRFKAEQMVYPDGVTYVGLRVSVLEFDFESGNNTLVSGDWFFYKTPLDATEYALAIPEVAGGFGMVFTLLEVGFFSGADSLVSVGGGNGLVVVDCK